MFGITDDFTQLTGFALTYNVVGGVAWVFMFTLAGYFFGGLQVVQDNFSLVIIVIILISVLPGVIEFLKERYRISIPRQNPKPSPKNTCRLR